MLLALISGDYKTISNSACNISDNYKSTAVLIPMQNYFDFYRHNFKQAEIFQMITDLAAYTNNMRQNNNTLRSIHFSEKIGIYNKDIINRVKIGIVNGISSLEDPVFIYFESQIDNFLYLFSKIQF